MTSAPHPRAIARWAHLDRSLACWRRRYPDLDLRVVAVGGSAVNYLAKHAADMQLVVVGL